MIDIKNILTFSLDTLYKCIIKSRPEDVIQYYTKLAKQDETST